MAPLTNAAKYTTSFNAVLSNSCRVRAKSSLAYNEVKVQELGTVSQPTERCLHSYIHVLLSTQILATHLIQGFVP